MNIHRKYSKAKANGNRVVWTSQEVIPVAYLLDGQAFDGAEWGVFRVTGRDMYCTGFRVDFRVPAGDATIQCNVGLYTADDVLAPSARLYLNGVTMGGEKLITPPLPMPVNSLWKFKLELESDEPDTTYYPQGLTATYFLRYAQGAVNRDFYATSLPAQGVGFDQIGTTFVIE